MPRQTLHLPGPTFIDDVMSASDRSPAVLRNLQSMFNHGRLGGTGHLSILPVDQGVEHSAGASSAPNPEYFDPKQAVKTAVINKRAGGTGLITGRKAFQWMMAEDVRLLKAVQDVYLDKDIAAA